MAITFGAFYWDINCKLKCHQILLDNLNLKTTGMYFLMVLEARSVKSRCQRATCPPKVQGSIFPGFFQHLAATSVLG